MKLFAALYHIFSERRGWLILSLLLFLGFCAWFLPQVSIKEDISSLLPDGRSSVARDFRLLQQAPFARKVVISLSAEDGITQETLISATDELAEGLPSELFSNIMTGPREAFEGGNLRSIGDHLPALLDDQDLAEIARRLTPDEIDARLARTFALLLQPQGVALKNDLRQDPLQLKELALKKLGRLNPIPGVQLEQGHFISAGGRDSLILADTPVPITDSAGAQKLLQAFERLQAELPQGVSARLVSGHAYTLANSQAIQGDMQRVLLLSGVGILLLFLLFLRSLRALMVFLLPLFSMLAALVCTAAAYGTLSGITVGFGAVLLGITIDFGLHVYFALRHGGDGQTADQVLAAVSRPVLFGGLTSFAAFAVLLNSELPGQRQLAVFAMAGIAAALLLSLVYLPHMIGARKNAERSTCRQLRRHVYDRSPGLRLTVLSVWLVVVGCAAWQAQSLSVNGELKRLGYLPQELQESERLLSEQWGNMRGRALLFAEGKTLEQALQRNERAWQLLNDSEQTVGLAPLLPSQQTQTKRAQRWEEFWQEHKATTLDLFRSSGQQLGFTESAFQPFWDAVDAPTRRVGREQLVEWGLAPMLDELLLQDEEGYRIVTLLPEDEARLSDLGPELAELAGVTLVSQQTFSHQLSREVGVDFSRFISFAGLVVLGFLILLFRRLSDVLLALLPVLSGLVVMFGCMAGLGLELNLFNVIASILIIGLGVDYGIFMVCHARQTIELASSKAILVSGLTTLAGFGALILARHPALHSIGLTVLLGISAAVPTAIFVIPAFRPKRV